MITRSKYDTSLSTFIWSWSTILGKNSRGKCEPSGFTSQVAEVAPSCHSLFLSVDSFEQRSGPPYTSLTDFPRVLLIFTSDLQNHADTGTHDAPYDDGETGPRQEWPSRTQQPRLVIRLLKHGDPEKSQQRRTALHYSFDPDKSDFHAFFDLLQLHS
jgi:hypothetical protein